MGLIKNLGHSSTKRSLRTFAKLLRPQSTQSSSHIYSNFSTIGCGFVRTCSFHSLWLQSNISTTYLDNSLKSFQIKKNHLSNMAINNNDDTKKEDGNSNNDPNETKSTNQNGAKSKGKGKRKWGDTKWSKNKRNPKGGKNNDEEKSKNEKKWHDRNADRDTVHTGSFADPEMRKLFNITLPEFDEEGDSNTDSKGDVGQEIQSVNPDEGQTDVVAPASASASTDEVNNNDSKEVEPKLPKRKIAILLQFLGTNYGGMQINDKMRSIQAEVELALYKAGLLAKTNFGIPKKYSWSNSARTDKGVHSCAQVCSVKIVMPTANLDKIRELINEQLPDDIRIADVCKVPKSFCARTQRDKVRYQYMVPSFVLQSSEAMKASFESVVGSDQSSRDSADPFTVQELKALTDRFRNYRATEESIASLDAALNSYQGTKKFHNYTSGKKWDDANAQRYILSFKVQGRIVDKNGMEWISTRVLGQSFLLHQIRKMVSHAFDVARGVSSLENMKLSFDEKYMNINRAPAQGLFLDMSFFDNYNKRAHAGDKLDWYSDDNTPASQRWKKFKEEKVMRHIMDEEEAQGNFISYIYQQEHHISFDNYEAVDEKVRK